MNDVTTEGPGEPPDTTVEVSRTAGPPPVEPRVERPGGPQAGPAPEGPPPEGPPPPGPGPEPSGPDGPRRRQATGWRRLWRRFLLFVRAYDRVVILVVVIVVLLLVFGVPRRHSGDGDGPGLGELPSYAVEFRDEHTMHVLTDATDPDDLRLVFDEAREGQRDGDWWDVVVRCASIPEEAGDTVLATGRFANTSHGQSATGLEGDEVEFQLTGRSTCAPVAPAVPGAVSAEDVFAAVDDAGLRVINARDSSDACAQIDCLERTLTDQFTVIVWPDGEAAQRWSDIATLDVWRLGPVTTVQVNEGGFDPDGPERVQYEQVFADLAAAHGTPGESPATSSPVGDVTGT